MVDKSRRRQRRMSTLEEIMPLPIRKRKFAGLVLLLGLVTSLVMMLAMAEIHERISHPFLERVDQAGMQAVHAHDTPERTRVAFALSRIGSPAVLIPAVGLAAVLLWSARLRSDAVVLVIAMGGASLLDTALKLHFRRVRPDVSGVHHRTHSLPSGHSVGAVVLYGIVTYLLWNHRARFGSGSPYLGSR